MLVKIFVKKHDSSLVIKKNKKTGLPHVMDTHYPGNPAVSVFKVNLVETRGFLPLARTKFSFLGCEESDVFNRNVNK